MMQTIAGNWWSVALRGVAAIVFGILAFLWPALTLVVLVFLFAAYALVDGVFMIASGLRGDAEGRHWLLVLGGVVGVIVAILTVVWPGITALVLLAFIAVWALVTGILEIAAAWRLRGQMDHVWPLVLNGALSVLFGFLLIVNPGAGALAVVWIIAAYAIASGVVLLILAWRLRQWHGQGPYGSGPEGLAP